MNGRKQVYLAGPIADLDYTEAQTWRTEAREWLADFDIDGISPLRGKEFLKGVGRIGTKEFFHPMASDSGIVARDRYDVKAADVMLVNFLNAEKVSPGTPAEFGWADAFGTPIVTVMEEIGNVYDHPFIRGLSGYRVETLEEGLEICRIILEV